jgi:hemin uptake protein HemP
MSRPPSAPPIRARPAEAPAGGQRVVLESAALFQGTTEVVIRHAGREYRLRRTRFDKLILTA